VCVCVSHGCSRLVISAYEVTGW